jgi:hypothetical protein
MGRPNWISNQNKKYKAIVNDLKLVVKVGKFCGKGVFWYKNEVYGTKLS